MYTPKSGINHPSSASGRAFASSNRRRSSMGTSVGGGTPYRPHTAAARSPYVTPLGSRLAQAGGSTPVTSNVGPSLLSQQNLYNVESYGSSLPALVMEALTFTDRSGEMSVVLSACGWAWLVTGRRLLVWRYSKDSATSTPGNMLGRPRSESLRPQFRELLLPQSDLAHRAQLVVLRQQDSSQTPSCMAVSPEGAVRYWPNIADENTYTEVTADLQGQECDSLVYLSSTLGYFLVTTTSTSLLLQPSPSPQHGELGINVRQVKVPAGLLGGLSRKVTSLMFGSMPTQAHEAHLVRVVCRGDSSVSLITVLVMTGEHLQCWQLSPYQSDSLLYQAPLLQLCQQALSAKLQAACIPSADGIVKKTFNGVWLLDMQPHPSNPLLITVLVGARNNTARPDLQTTASPSDLVLALVTVNTEQSPEGVSHVTILQHSETLSTTQSSTAALQQDPSQATGAAPPPQLLHYRLLLSPHTAYIHHQGGVLCVPLNDAGLAMVHKVAFSGDSLLGSGRLNSTTPLFFSSTHGIVAITGGPGVCPVNTSVMETTEEDSAPLSSSMFVNSEGLDILNSESSDKTSRLQAAFMYYCREDYAMSQSILEEIYPGGDYSGLSAAALKLSRNLLDDTPATDPRWAELGGGTVSGGAQLSLIIANQIRDKSKAHKFYVSFLQQTGLWGHLASYEGTSVRTLILEHTQRLAFATTLRTQHQQQHLTLLVDQAISEVVRERGDAITGRLTAADLFYWKLSSVEDIVWGLMQSVEQIISADVVPRDASAALHVTSSLVLTLLKAASAVTSGELNTHAPSINSSSGNSTPLEYVPWTASEGPKGVRTLLCSLHKAVVETGLTRAEDSPTKAKLYSVLVDLTDLILSGYQPQLASLVQPQGGARFELGGPGGYKLRDGVLQSVATGATFVPDTAVPINHERYQHLLNQYQKKRYNLIQPLVLEEQYSQALSLGEKYCDFRTLVEVCDKTSDSARLDKYMHQFAAQGFSDFVFRWHLETGKRGRLLSYSGGVTQSTHDGGSHWAGDLGRFLKGYNGLEWVHQLATRDFGAAHNTLKEQGLQETSFLARKKTLLSLSKLCRIADGQHKETNDDNSMDLDGMSKPLDPLQVEEDLILYQEQLPAEVLSLHNLNEDDMRVLTPAEMIELYTCDDNSSATELDFKKALDLLSFVGSTEEMEDLKRTIWVRAVMRDNWSSMGTDSPLDALSNTLLFKTIELAFTQGCSLKDLLVPVEELLAQEPLAPLKQDSGFTFLIQAGYEQMQQYLM